MWQHMFGAAALPLSDYSHALSSLRPDYLNSSQLVGLMHLNASEQGVSHISMICRIKMERRPLLPQRYTCAWPSCNSLSPAVCFNLTGPQQTRLQLLIRFDRLRSPTHGGSTHKFLPADRSFVVTSAQHPSHLITPASIPRERNLCSCQQS